MPWLLLLPTPPDGRPVVFILGQVGGLGNILLEASGSGQLSSWEFALRRLIDSCWLPECLGKVRLTL